MATAIQRRRGNTAQHASFTGLAGEITIDTEKNTVVVHDGVTAGGYPLARADEVEALGGADITAVIAGSGLTGGSTSGNATISLDYENLSGNLVPSANNTYSLGEVNKVWKDVYVGPGSLYVNGQQVLSDNSGTITVSADAGQNLSLVTSAGGDLELSSGATGDIQIKSNVVLSSGKTLTATGGLKLASNLDVNSQYINNVSNPVNAQDAATKAYVDNDATVVRVTGTQTIAGAKTFSSDATFSGNVSINGAITTVNSETISFADNIIDLNSNFTTGAPTENAGIKIKRGDSADVQVRWNETDDKWQFTNDGSAYHDMLTNSAARALLSAGGDLSYNSSTGVISFTERTDAEVRGLVSASGDLSYDNSTGVFSFTERTDAEVRGLVSAGGDLSYNSSTGVFSFTERTDGEVRGLISVTNASGDGSLGYNNATGVLTYTGPSATEVRAHFSAGTGVSLSSGQISIGQAVGTTDNVTFNDMTVSGNLTVSGTTTTVNTETINLADNIIVLNSNEAGTPSQNAGIEVERGTSTNKTLVWDETADKWTVGSETFVAGTFEGDVTGTVSSLANHDTADLAEGTNLYFTAARARGNISVTDNGGDGSLSYDNSTGVITYTGPSASEVRAHLSAGTGLSYSSGQFSITNTAVSAGVYGNGTQVAVLNVNAQGQITSASNLTVTPAVTSITGMASGMADFLAAGNAATFAGAVSGVTGSGNIVLANSPVLVSPALGTPSALVLTNATGLTVGGIAAASLLTSGESFVDTDTQLMTAAAIDDRILSYGYTTNVGDITGVSAGNGLTGGGSSGDVTLNVVGGYGITVNADNVEVANADIRGLFSGSTGVSYNSSTGAFTLNSSTAGSGLTISSGVLSVGAGTGISVAADTVSLATSGVSAGTYGNATAVSQVVVDTYGRVTSASNVSISITASQVSDFESAVRGDISVTDAGGDGSLSYNSGTGVITYTGPSAAEVRAHFSAGTGISISSGTITNSGVTSITGTSNQVTASASTGGVTLSLPQNIHTGASPTFAGATLSSITKGGTDGTGDIGQSNNKFATVYATTFSGVSTTAKYADLAERYEADDVLEPGTVVCFGGAKEITACDHPNDHAVAGVISTDPAYMMNSDAGTDATHPYVALTGRVPVKVTGEVNKGDLLVASDVKGHAMANNNAKAGTIIGKALGSSAGGEAVIEALVHLM